jgi:lactate permease
MDLRLLFSYLPIVLLIYLMTRKNNMPSHKALPLTALVLYFIVLIVFRYDAGVVHAQALQGMLTAFTPILIIAGAIFLFRTMEVTGGLAVIRLWLNSISQNKIGQLMIVGWAFPFLIEGASGFGTPAALAAPVLVGLGFPPVRVAILSLIMNSVPVSFGAVGTPTWFGFSALTLSRGEILEIGFKSALMNGVAALVIPAIALSFVVKPKSVLKNWRFILLSILCTVIPYVIIARFSYEFPSLISGFIGLVVTTLLAKKGIGLSPDAVEVHEKVGESSLIHSPASDGPERKIQNRELLKATFPLWGTILILIITRIPAFGIKHILQLREPTLDVDLGSLGILGISPSLVVSLKEIFNTAVAWSHSVLYVPSLIPFLFISFLTFLWYRTPRNQTGWVWKETLSQMRKPALALFGALVFVNFMMMGNEQSAVTLIGKNLADLTGRSWSFFASYLGALGSFFSGSNTISNLTFGGIQDSIAADLGLNRTTILALQSVGGAMGNMVCINNIVAVASVLALDNREGYILKRTVWPVILYGIIAGLVAQLF